MKFDLHIHSKYSGDSKCEPRDIIKTAEKRDLDGIAILDHNSIKGYEKAQKVDTDLIIVPGIEVSTPDGHIIAMGLREEIGKQASISEAIDRIRERGALAIAAHPYRFWSGVGEKNILKNEWDGIDGQNGRGWGFRNRQARALAEKMGVPVIGGSDSHRLKTIGKAFTMIGEADTWEDVIQKIEKGKTKIGGEDRTFKQTFFYVRRAISGYIMRGFESI